jgi:hypothetical protein
VIYDKFCWQYNNDNSHYRYGNKRYDCGSKAVSELFAHSE